MAKSLEWYRSHIPCWNGCPQGTLKWVTEVVFRVVGHSNRWQRNVETPARIGNRDWWVSSVCCMVNIDGDTNSRIYSFFFFFLQKNACGHEFLQGL